MTMDLAYLKNKKLKFFLRTDEATALLSLLSFVVSDEVQGLFKTEEDRSVIMGIGIKIAKQCDERLDETPKSESASAEVDKQIESSLD